MKFSREQIREGAVPFRVKFGQGFGALPGQHKDWVFNTLLLLFYSQILGLPASNVSYVLAVALVTDAVTDPLVGAWSDSFRSSLGRRHPFMIAAIIPVAICIYALFSPPMDMSDTQNLAWLCTFTILFRASYTLFSVPYSAMAAELSTDYLERTSIITYRMAVGWIVGVIFIFSMYTFVFPSTDDFANGLMDPARYHVLAIVVAVLMVLWMTITVFATRSQVRFMAQPTSAVARPNLKDMVSRMLQALESRNFRLLFISVLTSAGIIGTGQVFDVYMNIYFWEFATEDIRWLSFAVLGAIASFATASALVARWEKQQILVCSFCFLTVFAICKVLFRFLDIWPDNGSPALLWIFVVHICFMAYFASMVLIMFASMMADIVDEQELVNGLRQEGVFSAGITVAGKATTALGLIVGGLLLDMFVGFSRDAVPGEVSEATLFRLALADGILVPILYFFPLIFMARYRLSRDKLSEIQHELRRRREQN